MTTASTARTEDPPALPKAEGVLRILQITDTHVQANPAFRLLGLDTNATMNAVVDLAAEQFPDADLVLATGDLAHDDGAAAYQRVGQAFAKLRLPVYCLPGNHDEAKALNQHAQPNGLRTESVIDVGRWRLIMLDSSIDHEAGGRLVAAQQTILQRAQADAGDRFILVCLHHPPVAVGCDWLDTMMLANADQFWPMLVGHPAVRGVVFGHIHQRYDQHHKGIRLLGAPSTCVQFAPNSPGFSLDPATPGLRWIDLDADGGLNTGVVRISHYPEGFDPTSTTGY